MLVTYDDGFGCLIEHGAGQSLGRHDLVATLLRAEIRRDETEAVFFTVRDHADRQVSGNDLAIVAEQLQLTSTFASVRRAQQSLEAVS